MYEIFILRKDLTVDQYKAIFGHWETIASSLELQKKFCPLIYEEPDQHYLPNVLPYSVMGKKQKKAPSLRHWLEWDIQEIWWKEALSIYGTCRFADLRLPEFLYHHVGIRPELILVSGDGYEKWEKWHHRAESDYEHWFSGDDAEYFDLDHESGYWEDDDDDI